MSAATKNLTDAEVWLQLARESLQRFGTALPPGFNGSLQIPLVQPKADAPVKAASLPVRKRKPRQMVGPNKCVCPHCDETKAYPEDFGTTSSRGKTIVLSWCKACRSKTSAEYRSRPRTYKTKP